MVLELRADCARCAALCCVAPAFAKSSDFAITKPAGTPCPNLAADFRCGIHEHLEPRGFKGCTVFDCFGAGHPHPGTFGGRDWRSAPEIAGAMNAACRSCGKLHELLWYMTEALALDAARGCNPKLQRAGPDRTTHEGNGAKLAAIDRTRTDEGHTLLRKPASCAAGTGRRPDHRGGT